MWRPYIVSNKYGKRQAMRDTKLYDSKKKAISSMKKKNDRWMTLNYDDQFINDSGFEYGAIDVGAGKYKFKKGKEGRYCPPSSSSFMNWLIFSDAFVVTVT